MGTSLTLREIIAEETRGGNLTVEAIVTHRVMVALNESANQGLMSLPGENPVSSFDLGREVVGENLGRVRGIVKTAVKDVIASDRDGSLRNQD